MSLILCGLPGCGKSYYAKKVAKALSMTYLDTDHIIEELYGASCRDIYRNEGELFFRNLEKKVIASLTPGAIIATGGGSLLSEDNVHALRFCGHLVYLKASKELILQRESTFVKALDLLEKERVPLFEKYCDSTVDANSEECLWQLIALATSLKSLRGENLMVKP